jgi:nucleolar pre-ribosomal-associated protein 2
MKGNTFRDLLQTIFWIASVPQDNTLAISNSWLRNNPDIFSSTWTSLLHNDEVLSNLVLISLIIDIMLCNAANDANPLIRSPTANSFAVQCLLELPLECFSRKDRERVMTTWLPKTNSCSDEPTKQCAALGGAVLSLKVKVMQRPTMYEGAKYQDLVFLADALASAKIESLDVSLLCFKELVRRTMSHVTANLDQTRNREYVLDSLSHLRKNLNASNNETHKLNFALVALLEVLFGLFTSREIQLNELDIIPRPEFLGLKKAFQNYLLSQLESLLTKIKKSSKPSKQAERSVMLRSIMDALAELGADSGKIASTVAEARPFAASLKDSGTDLVRRLESLISISTLSPNVPAVESQLEGDISTVYGRQALAERTCEFIKLKDQRQKLALLQSSLEQKWSWTQLDKLWAVRHMIISCEGLC